MLTMVRNVGASFARVSSALAHISGTFTDPYKVPGNFSIPFCVSGIRRYMMRYITIPRLLAALILALALGLTACGKNSQPNTNNGASSATNTPQSHATSAPGTGAPGQVKLVLSKSQYASNEGITVTIMNGLSSSIYASSYYTNCTLLALEWKTSKGWVSQGRCLSAQSTHVIELKPGSVTSLQLTPISGPFNHTANFSWQPGTCRVTLYYSMAPDQDTTQGANAQSPDFTIG
jgi:hypothetical protein